MASRFSPQKRHLTVVITVSRRSLEMRVRATDPRPCPKCGKIYRSAHTLRTHLEDKHTVCPGYRCVLCGTVAKSRNSLHSHMSRQHRGISTKDLPVLPMPSPFDPELASRLLAKAGVKISPAELRARASPTGTRRNDGMKLELRSGEGGEDFDDPEDLTMSQSSHSETQRRFHESMMGMSPTGKWVVLAFYGCCGAIAPPRCLFWLMVESPYNCRLQSSQLDHHHACATRRRNTQAGTGWTGTWRRQWKRWTRQRRARW